MTQAALAEAWGLREAADRFRREAVEEMQHAERLVKRMLGLGAAPNASQLRPAGWRATLWSICCCRTRCWRRRSSPCTTRRRVLPAHRRSRERRVLQRGLLQDEMHHAAEIEQWLESLGRAAPSRGRDF
jgi:bacterioferritin